LGRVGLGTRSCVRLAGIRFAELGTPFGTRSQARSNTTDGEPSHRAGTWLEQAISRLKHASPSIPTPIVLNPTRPRESPAAHALPVRGARWYRRGRGPTHEAGLNVTSRACARRRRVMLAAMPKDAATEVVEHVRNLASERREVFDPAGADR
jgi:hypothetical protein